MVEEKVTFTRAAPITIIFGRDNAPPSLLFFNYLPPEFVATPPGALDPMLETLRRLGSR